MKMLLKWSRQRILTRLILIMGGLIIGLLLVEGGLRLFEVFGSDRLNRDLTGREQIITDEKVGIRVTPDAPGHDANGFRNDVVPARADIVAIGDSQTWGNNAGRSHAWPQTVERLSGYGTYNMGLGYYGPVEYWLLIQEALQLSPKVIIIGLYFGNDIWGAYNTVYLTDRQPGFRDSDVDTTLFTYSIESQALALADENTEYETGLQRSIFYKWAMILREHSAAVRVLTDGLKNLIEPTYHQGKAWAQANPDHGAFYENEGVRTVLMPAYRLLGLDMQEPRIIEGLRITKEMLLLIQTETDAADVKLLVLLIPTIEAVYADAVAESQGCLSTTYTRLVKMEEQVRNEIVLLCKVKNIEYADALPALKGAVQQNEQIYPSSGDSHPVAMGYYYIASTVWEKIGSLGWLR